MDFCQCPYCLEQFKDSQLKDHVEICENRSQIKFSGQDNVDMIPCELCNKLVEFLTYQNHIFQHYQQEDLSFQQSIIKLKNQYQQKSKPIQQLPQSIRTFAMQARHLPKNQHNYEKMHQIEKMTDEELYEFFTELDKEEKKGYSEEKLLNLNSFKFLKQSEEEENNKCPVCLEEYQIGQELIAIQCAHKFHKSCAISSLMYSKMCPICKIEVNDSLIK